MRARRVGTGLVFVAGLTGGMLVTGGPMPLSAAEAGPPPEVGCAGSIIELVAPLPDGSCGGAGDGVTSPSSLADQRVAASLAAAPEPLTGVVTDEFSQVPLAGVMVVAVPAFDAPIRGALTGATGAYSLPLAEGSYRVQFVDPSGRHRPEWFDDRGVADIEHSTPVEVGGPQPTTADAALAPAGASGAIAGQVVQAGTGGPVAGAWVVALRAATGAIAGGALSASDGSFAVGGLEPHAYRVAVVDPAAAHSNELFYPDQPTFGTGDDVVVAAGQTTEIDVDLVARAAPTPTATLRGTITGSVSDDPVGGAWVAAVNANTGEFTAATEADDAGRYQLELPAGGYRIQVIDSTGDHLFEWHPDVGVNRFDLAGVVTVTAGDTVEVDEDLTPLTGDIVGVVTETGSSTSIPGAWVIALRSADGAPVGLGVADAAGRYRIAGLDATGHVVAVLDPSGAHRPELFSRDRGSFSDADAVMVVGGGTVTVDADLDPPPPPTVSHFTASVDDTNRVTLDWATEGGDASGDLYIFDESTPSNPSTGFLPQDGTTSFRVASPGVRRYRLAVDSDAGGRVVVTAAVTVPFVARPVVTSSNPALVDEIVKTDVTISWTHPPGGFARVTRPNGTKVGVAGTPSGGTVTGSIVATAASLKSGRNSYAIEFCQVTPDPLTPLCGESVPVDVMVGPQRFTGDYRRPVTPGETVTLSWTGSGGGRFFRLDSDRLGLDAWSTGSSMDVTVPADASGVYDVALTTCGFVSGGVSVCANQDRIATPAAGVVAWAAPFGSHQFAGWEVARVTTATGVVSLKAVRTGRVTQVFAPEGTTVAAGDNVVMMVDPEGVDHQQLVVTERAWETRPVLADFASGPADRVPIWRDPAIGSPLDVHFSPDGDLWTTGEFGYALARWDGTDLEALDVPLLTKLDGNDRHQRVNPFALFGGNSNTYRSALVERVIWAAGKVWFTQGGGLFGPTTGNRSRVLSFDPAAVDLPHTDTDDRFCAVNVPNDGAEVVGLVYDGERIWFTESSFTRAPSVNSFDPDELPCDNLLDFSDPDALANSVHRYCTEPGEHGCIRRIEISGGAGVSHVEYDPTEGAEGSIWATEFYAGAITKVDIATGAVQRYLIPPSSRPYGLGGFFGGSPWQLRVDEEYVYYLDYADVDLVRFHKDTEVFEELHLPMRHTELGGHSIELVGDRLWFTEGGRASEAAAVGYVDTADWGPGVIYTGLSDLVDADRAAVGLAAPAGIAVSAEGTVAVADYRRRQVLLLRPLAGAGGGLADR